MTQNPFASVYHKRIKLDGSGRADVYAVLAAFDVTDQALGHAIKKLLAPGGRNGGKSREQDLKEAIASIQRSIDLSEGYK